MDRERRRNSRKRFFKITTKKSKAGEVSVTELRNGFRTLSVSGKIRTSSYIFNLAKLQKILKSIGKVFLGFFPFLKQEKSTFIATYSIPTTYHNTRIVYMNYEFCFTISAVNIPVQTVISTVLNKMEWLGEQISLKVEDAIVCMKEEQKLSSSPVDLPEIFQLMQQIEGSP